MEETVPQVIRRRGRPPRIESAEESVVLEPISLKVSGRPICHIRLHVPQPVGNAVISSVDITKHDVVMTECSHGVEIHLGEKSKLAGSSKMLIPYTNIQSYFLLDE